MADTEPTLSAPAETGAARRGARPKARRRRCAKAVLSWRNALSAAFLCLPLFGLYLVLDGLHHGPNHFDQRTVRVVDLERQVYVSTLQGRETGREERWQLTYLYRDRHDQPRVDSRRLHEREVGGDIARLRLGDELSLRIAVDREEGRFELNSQVEQGLALLLVYSVIVLPLVLLLQWRHKSWVKRHANAIIVTPLALMLLWLAGVVLMGALG